MARTRRTAQPAETPALPDPKPRYVLYAEWLKDNTGYDLDPAVLQVAITRYTGFQKSPENRAANEERRAARTAPATERASSTKRSTKATKTAETETAAAASAPKSRGKRTTKSTSATKTTGRRGRKAAAEKADAPY